MGYRGKVAEQERARALRADGWTMPDIAAELGVSRGSVSAWTRDVPFTPGPRRGRKRGPHALQRAKAAEIEAGREEGRRLVGDPSERDLFIAGIALYAGEGAKGDGRLSFTNSDHRMVAMFLRWLRTCFVIDESKLRLRLYLHDGLDLDAATEHWEAVTGIPRKRFTKPYRAEPDPSIRKSKHPMGCATVVYYSATLHRRVMGLVDALLPSSGRNPG